MCTDVYIYIQNCFRECKIPRYIINFWQLAENLSTGLVKVTPHARHVDAHVNQPLTLIPNSYLAFNGNDDE